jgi:hypothetical protein
MAMISRFMSSRMNIDDRRLRVLHDAAYGVRQRAISRGDDLEGWRLARLMRDAETRYQLVVAERRYAGWLKKIRFRKLAVA